MSGKKHTVILIQHTPQFSTRTYVDFDSVNGAMDAIVKMYEHKLKELNPGIQHITYDISDLYNYIDSLHDICGLVCDPATSVYEPKGRDWIKAKVFQQLKQQAA
mmetsp:Transcript_10444/g.15895  ORF Transcript_10444/g.15895 Transcript_10444/m.15895 type:complete len:104 (+) Transcript_10444:109-420(+)|eukprot:CAMPEP_0185017668 /NCGR_PEP_ID=MMETSP1103-20130426/592_1 /TAXON_ID=36769 /ORGANISM="Paraphysomonas bandaiensis, Strain Caron Lab Isolate" /LENGTH=103 /DNA_ID=CAMNT_0027547185 /DNA_START=84 /DNA_END=395 /DNA_ORIENTATION=+